jgi:opacity protein-like surface antigen
MKATVIVAFLVGASAWAQPISFGVRAGVPINGPFEDVTRSGERTFSDSNGYVAGVMVELHLPAGFSVEADGLYQPLHLTQQFPLSTGAVVRISDSFKSWVFPVVAKYRFLRVPLAKPYAEAGPSFRAVENAISYFSNTGLTLGAGVEFKLSKLRIEPELRYTRWRADAPATPSGGNLAPSNANQVQFLVGLAF